MFGLGKSVFALALYVDGKFIHLVPPLDEDGTKAFLCWPTMEQAKVGLAHQQEAYFQDGDEDLRIVKLGITNEV